VQVAVDTTQDQQQAVRLLAAMMTFPAANLEEVEAEEQGATFPFKWIFLCPSGRRVIAILRHFCFATLCTTSIFPVKLRSSQTA
ncbi:MAG: hypothetical protein D3909_13975, partial [Candidatus Electrothrix sp. ATG1]|nr:hypothetical protein [Candidatus Electrothrix sp. ATG1]